MTTTSSVFRPTTPSKNATSSAKNLKIALACDWLTTPGGAEKVLLELHKMYPNAPIYTSQYRPKRIDWFKNATVKTGWLNFFPASLRKVLGPLRQLYFSRLNLRDYDLVISVTGAEAKSLNAKKHLCYCHVPTQYYWQMYDRYIENPGFGILNPLIRTMFRLLVKPLRRADYRAAQRPDQFITISTYAAAQIQKYYHRDSIIVAPPVETTRFAPQKATKRRGFVIVCRQVTWKKVDLAIKACLKTGQPLTVVGDGPEHQNLIKLAKNAPNITFIPWVSSDKVAEYLQKAEAFIFPSLEPFGIAAVEALAAGTPVIAYQDGGSRDFIQPGKNGLLFEKQTVSSLKKALLDFENHKFNTKTVQKTADNFSAAHFQEGIKHAL